MTEDKRRRTGSGKLTMFYAQESIDEPADCEHCDRDATSILRVYDETEIIARNETFVWELCDMCADFIVDELQQGAYRERK